MDIIITPMARTVLLIWLAFALAGLKAFKDWYKIKGYDRVIHFFSGIVIAIIMVDSGFSISTIIITNIILGFIWEWFQTKTKEQISWRIFGLPEGYNDILVHVLGSITYLYMIGLISF